MITPNKKYKFVTQFLKPALLMICLFVLTSVTAMAQAPCVPVDIAPPSDPALQVFEVEGKIQSYNSTARTTTPWWIANNGTGTTTLYNVASRTIVADFIVPGAGGEQGNPTGLVFNNKSSWCG